MSADTKDTDAESGTAEREGQLALASVFQALDDRANFILEAGAGAGKTYSLIAALRRILNDPTSHLSRPDQKIACLTYTKVARDEIVRRTDASPRVFADTLHGFLWEMIAPFQRSLAEAVLRSAVWSSVLGDRTSLEGFDVEYDLGIRGIGDHAVRLHHDDVPRFAIELFTMPKFRSIITDRFPIIFVDEYQDTPDGLIEALLSGGGSTAGPLLGFFGDEWQQIYDKSAGPIAHPDVRVIAKNANFRSDHAIVDFLNGLRPELKQKAAADAEPGTVTIYHANSWQGERQGGAWKGDISASAARAVLNAVASDARRNVWVGSSENTKTLMLTHTALANELGYGSLPPIFKYNEAFAKKEDDVIAFLLDVVEPACDAFRNRKYGDLFEALGRTKPHIRSHADKVRWREFFAGLEDRRAKGSVGELLDKLLEQRLFSIPSSVIRRQKDLTAWVPDADPAAKPPRRVTEYKALRDVRYTEIIALSAYVAESSLFSTKHNVKGAEYDNVITLIGRGWPKYDFAKMLGNHAGRNTLDDTELKKFKVSRNLFYVAASRARHNLALVFTQELNSAALTALASWAGPENIVAVEFTGDDSPVINRPAVAIPPG